MHLMHPTLDPTLWSLDELFNSLVCMTCAQEFINVWHVCLRRSCAINLHPEYLSRERQHFYCVMIVVKFLPIPDEYYGPITYFKGPHKPMIQENPRDGQGIPKFMQPKSLIRYGEF